MPPAAAAAPVVLVPGGLWEDMDADRFWVRPGVVAGLTAYGLEVLAPDRLPRAESWVAEVDHLLALLPPGRATLVAGSNGCSVVTRLALDRPDRVARLVLAWPATAGDPAVDARVRADLLAGGGSAAVAAGLLAGDTLRGVSDAELVGLGMPVAVLPSVPENPDHQRRTVDALLGLLPSAVELAGAPESPRPEFPASRDAFVAAVAGVAR